MSDELGQCLIVCAYCIIDLITTQGKSIALLPGLQSLELPCKALDAKLGVEPVLFGTDGHMTLLVNQGLRHAQAGRAGARGGYECA